MIIGVVAWKSEPFGDSGRRKVSEEAAYLGKAVVQEHQILLTGHAPSIGEPLVEGMEAPTAAALAARDSEVNVAVIAVRPRTSVPEDFTMPVRPWGNGYRLLIGTGLTSAQRNPINALTPDVLLCLAGRPGTVSETIYALNADKIVLFAPQCREQISDRLRLMLQENDVDTIVEADKKYRLPGTSGKLGSVRSALIMAFVHSKHCHPTWT